MTRIVICDDHAIVRDGLKNLLNQESDMEVVGEAADGLQAFTEVRTSKPDIVLMDINMPNLDGLSAVSELMAKFPSLRILIFTMYGQEEYLFKTIRAGACGYVTKDAPIGEVIQAIRKVTAGEHVIQSRPFPEKDTEPIKEDEKGRTSDGFSPREREVLEGLVNGLSNKEIAGQLFITETTVKLHIGNIYRKLGVRSRSQAILCAVRENLVVIK